MFSPLHLNFPLKIVLTLTTLTLLAFFLSYRLLDVPPGLTQDEASFGYNAVLLSRTLHDQNGRLLPVFVLASDQLEWRQPFTQYYLTAVFKLFGPSVFNLRFSSVILTLASAVLLFFLSKQLFSRTLPALFSVFIFLTTPLVIIQSHYGLDNLMPVPFVILWILGLLLFHRSSKLRYLVLAGISLGASFYTYKAMRAVVPVWTILSLIYLILPNTSFSGNHKSTFSKSTKNLNQTASFFKFSSHSTFVPPVIFFLSLLPFFAIIPLLELKYAGAVFGHQPPSLNTIYALLYPYLSTYDPGFLFIKGDSTPYHSTGIHGMFLLTTLPLFLIGCYQAISLTRHSLHSEQSPPMPGSNLDVISHPFWLFILSAFLTAPLLFGLVDSVHRASRLMAIIPPYCLLTTAGILWLWKSQPQIIRKIILPLSLFLILINFTDFINYYWHSYPQEIVRLTGNFDQQPLYQTLARESQKHHLTPYLSVDPNYQFADDEKFFQTIYFPTPPQRIPTDQLPPPGSILLSPRQGIPGMTPLDTPLPNHRLFIN